MEGLDFRHRLARIIDADRAHDKASMIYDWCMIVVIVLSLLPLMFLSDNNPVLDFISWATVIVFLIDFIARCYVSPVDKYKVGLPWWRRYPFSFMGAVDFLSILPVFGMINNKLYLFKLFRLARIVAIIKYTRYSDKDDLLLRVLKRNLSVIKTISIFMLLYVYISALLIYNIEPHINPSTGEETFSTFFDAVYWSVVTLTTVGYGDIYPVTLLGKIISICSMICGIGMIATASSVVTAGIIEEINKLNQSKSNIMAKVTIKGVYQMNGPKPFQRVIECSSSETSYYSQLMGNKSKQAQWIRANFPGADTDRGFSMTVNIN